MSIQQRKKDHVDLTINDETQYSTSSGFEQYQLIHNALPEVNFDEIDTSVSFLGRRFSFPLFISSMTGGYAEGGGVNAIIAEFCEKHNLPFGVGSQRAMLEHPEEIESFSIVRKKAPTAFICSNIGGAQLIGGLPQKKLDVLINSIQANAVIVHLNPLQELMQPEGDRNFKGITAGIAQLVEESPVPVIVKETGAGISAKTANTLAGIGVKVIDIAGSGGTSWAKVEHERSGDTASLFGNWGISTLHCLQEVAALNENNSFEIISSGGIRTALDIAKSICFGAHITAIAQPVIKAIHNDGPEGLETYFNSLQKDLKTALCLVGKDRASDLSLSDLRAV